MMSDEPTITRREAIAVAVGAAAATAATGLTSGSAEASEREQSKRTTSTSRMPVAFLPHGGGPWPFVDMGMDDKPGFAALRSYLESVRSLPKTPPKALLVISAHWEEAVPTVMTAERPPMFYDYYGFPAASYSIQWAAPGAPALAERVRKLLGDAGFPTAADPERGFDHGTFVPLKLTYPDAAIPTIQLSLKRGLDPAEHLAMGRALAPLRDEGVFIIGSGMTFHDLRGFFQPRSKAIAEAFDAWLRETMALDSVARDQRLIHWAEAPSARAAHPREEHLIPLMVIAGAAGTDRATLPYNGTYVGLRLSAYHFG